MPYQLVIAEKPSVARHIASALKCTSKGKGYVFGANYIITWAFGHLLALAEPQDYNPSYAKWNLNNLPIIPSTYKYKVINGKQQQLTIIESLAQRTDVTNIIIATDWDREGQVIGDSILANIKYPSNKTVYRLLLNEWTEKEIKQQLNSLTLNSAMKPLSDAGFCRQHMDWLIGMNFTEGVTLTKGQGHVLNVGRVILPTLKILYDNLILRKNFKPSKYYELSIKLKDINTPTVISFQDKASANKTAREIKNSKEFVVTMVGQSTQEEYPKLLFSLTSLQAYITENFEGWTSDKVLKVCQSLYEKQLITYPRTESTYLDESTLGKTKGVFNSLAKNYPDEEIRKSLKFKGGKTIFNSSKVKAHGAIIPTYKTDYQDLTPDETFIYVEILQRFLAKFMPNSEYEVLTINGTIGTSNYEFTEKNQKSLGWKALYKLQLQNTQLKTFQIGDKIPVEQVKVIEKTTEPPLPITESNLLRLMESCGKASTSPTVLQGYALGTPATRASILKHMKDVGYIEQHGKVLAITNKGKYLVENFPIKELLNLDFTGEIEKNLSDVESGVLKGTDLELQIEQFVDKGVQLIKDVGTRNVIEKCPVCGGYIIDGVKGYGCTNFTKGCEVVLFKQDIQNTLGIIPTNEFMASLLKYKQITVPVGTLGERTYTYIINPDNTIQITEIKNVNHF